MISKMETIVQNEENKAFESSDDGNENALSKATKLTPLELNNIKMDVRHTVLTPDYLEKIASLSD